MIRDGYIPDDISSTPSIPVHDRYYYYYIYTLLRLLLLLLLGLMAMMTAVLVEMDVRAVEWSGVG